MARFWNTCRIFDALHAVQHCNHKDLQRFVLTLNEEELRRLISSIFVPYRTHQQPEKINKSFIPGLTNLF